MTSFKRTQRKYVQKAYRVRNWREYETGLRARGSLTVWLGLTDGKLANWNSPRPTRRKPGRQRKYSNHAIETTVTLGLVFGLASRQTEGFLRSLLTLLNLDNDVPDHSTISRRKARLGKVASYERRTVKPVHLLIDSSGLSVHVGQLRTPPKARDYRKLHLAVDEQTSDVVACELTSKRARGCACAQGHRHRARRLVERGGLAHTCGREQSLACGVGTPEPSDSTPGSAAEHLNRRVRNRTHGGVGGREG